MRARLSLPWTAAAVAVTATSLGISMSPAEAAEMSHISQWQEIGSQRRDQYDQYQAIDETEEEVYFTFELLAENICNDASDGQMMPDTKASIEEGCLNWVQDLTELSREELETRNAKRGEDGDDDFLDLFLMEDLDVTVMVLSDFVDGTSCDANSPGSYGYRRSLQQTKLSRGSISGRGNCRRCKQQKTKERYVRILADLMEEGAVRRLPSTGNLTAALVEVGFKDAKNVGFANFRIKDCADSTGPDCNGAFGEYACCGFKECACQKVSETLCFEEKCNGVDGLCCEPNPFSGAPYLYPHCANTCAASGGGATSSASRNIVMGWSSVLAAFGCLLLSIFAKIN